MSNRTGATTEEAGESSAAVGSDVEQAWLTRRVVVSQTLFTAGNALTVGGFFNYFVNSFQPTALWQAALQTAPELCESLGVFTRPLVRKLAGRKRLWIGGLLLGRTAALGVPLVALLATPGLPTHYVLGAMLACVAVWYACQGMGYIAYLSWLSDLAPEQRWGRFFARRQSAALITALLISTTAILASRWARTSLDAASLRTFLTSAFFVGGVLTAVSILPMRAVPSVAVREVDAGRPFSERLASALRDRPFRSLLLWSCHLAWFQGLTQAVFTRYQIDVLGISLEWFLAMNALMLLLQTAASLLAGQISDRFGDVRALFVSSLLVAFAMLFPLAATRETWWLQFGAYAVWGLFGVVNLCSQTLSLRISPRSDNTLQLGLFRPLGGLFAALAGLLGGYCLDRLLVASGRDSFSILFGISFAGRLTAPLWLLGIPVASGERPRAESTTRAGG